MKKCQECRNTMFDADINKDDFCEKCVNSRELQKHKVKVEEISECKGCGEQFRIVYLSPDKLCHKCDKKKSGTENKQEITNWLNDNAGKPENEIRSFLLSKIESTGQEFWQKYYVLQDLKIICKDCPDNILGIIKDLENENKQQTKQEGKTKRRWGGYIIAGIVFAIASDFRKTSSGELIVLIIAAGTWFFYYRLKSKLKIKNETVKIVTTFVILYIAAGLLIGFLTSLVNL